MINYDKILTLDEISEYISNVWKRDPGGYDSDSIQQLLDKIRKSDKITFGELINMLSSIYNY